MSPRVSYVTTKPLTPAMNDGGDGSATPTIEYIHLASPHPIKPNPNADKSPAAPSQVLVPGTTVLFTSACFMLFPSIQVGWAVAQLNLAAYHDEKDCAAKPIVPGTCLMFPGHTPLEWTVIVNIWIAAGMIGSLSSGYLADHFGRRRLAVVNTLAIILGAVILVLSPTIGVYTIGRIIGGFASGIAAMLPNGYINEITPPHLRNTLGSLYQIAIGLGILLAGLALFLAGSGSSWRVVNGLPIVFCVIFLLAVRWSLVVESPTWLLGQGRRDEALTEVAKLYGSENVWLALSWMETASDSDTDTTPVDGVQEPISAVQTTSSPWRQLWSSEYRRQTILAVGLSMAQQLSGINAVFLYSSSIFTEAGLADSRIGSLIVNIVNIVPVLFAGTLGTRFGNRRMIILGHVGMGICAAGVTVSLVTKISVLSIIFLASYVAIYAISLGPLVFVVEVALFPDVLRAQGTALCIGVNWCATLIVGICYPYIASALGDFGFVPFVVILATFGILTFRYLPETEGKTTEEIQQLFRPSAKSQQENAC